MEFKSELHHHDCSSTSLLPIDSSLANTDAPHFKGHPSPDQTTSLDSRQIIGTLQDSVLIHSNSDLIKQTMNLKKRIRETLTSDPLLIPQSMAVLFPLQIILNFISQP